MGLLIVCCLVLAPEKPARKPVVAMVLHASPGAVLLVGKEAQPLRDMDLLREADVVRVSKDPVRVVFLVSGQGERILPGKTVTVGKSGCSPPQSVEKFKSKTTPAIRRLHKLLTSERAGVGVARGPSLLRPPVEVIGWPIPESKTLSQRPTFRWPALPGAIEYEVRVESVPDKEPRLLWKETTKKTVLSYPSRHPPLALGSDVLWSVTAVLPEGKRKEVVPPSELTVASRLLRKTLADLTPLLESNHPEDWLLAALVYESRRLYTEAMPLYEKADARRPRQPNILEALRFYYDHTSQKDRATAVRKRLLELGDAG
jgi:hypothetical protein